MGIDLETLDLVNATTEPYTQLKALLGLLKLDICGDHLSVFNSFYQLIQSKP